jgi:hypothetical protein
VVRSAAITDDGIAGDKITAKILSGTIKVAIRAPGVPHRCLPLIPAGSTALCIMPIFSLNYGHAHAEFVSC